LIVCIEIELARVRSLDKIKDERELLEISVWNTNSRINKF